MSVISEIIKRIIRRRRSGVESRHYKNLMDGEKLTFEGKKYIRVKLQFTDTLVNETTYTITKLESEIDFLHEKIKLLNERENYYKRTFAQLNELSKNLIYENAEKIKRLQNEKKVLVERNITLINENKVLLENQNLIKNRYKNKIEELTVSMNEYIELAKKYKLTLIKPGTRIVLTGSDGSNKNSDLQVKKLKEKIKQLEKELQAFKRTISEKDELLRSQTKKIFEKEAKINELLSKK